MTETGRGNFAAALNSVEFRALWLAEAQSVFGDQVARVALALLVYARTSSASLTALTYALTFAPAVLGGVVLSGLADRYSRRTVIIATDVVRGSLAAAMAVPGMPLWLLWCLIGMLTLSSAPFKAAQLALLPEVLPREVYQAGLGLRQITIQTAQVAGFGLGGLLVTTMHTSGALLVNAATFLASAMIVMTYVRRRPRPAAERVEPTSPSPIHWDPRLVAVYMLAGLVGLLVVPEGLAAPYAAAVGVTSVGVGLLMAADPLGSVVGGWWAGRSGHQKTYSPRSVIVPAALSGLPLAVCAVLPGVWWAIALWAIAGALSTIYLVRLQAAVVDLVPNARRGTVMGRLTACLYSSQGIAIVGAGAVAERLSPSLTVAASGALASLSAIAAGFVWRAACPRQPKTAEDDAAGFDGVSSPVLVTHGDPLPEHPALGGAEVRTTQPDNLEPFTGNGSGISMPKSGPVTRAGRSRWAIWSLSRPTRAFVLLIDVAALITIAIGATIPVTRRDVLWCLTIIGFGVLAAEMSKRVERRRRRFSDTPHVNFSSVWTFAAALLLPTALAATVVVVLYLHLWFRSWRGVVGIHAHRVVFSACNVILSCQVAAWAAHRLDVTPFGSAPSVRTALGLAALILIYFVVNSTVVGTVIAISRSNLSIKRLLGSGSENLLELATLCMGALTTVLLALQAPLVLLIFLPLYALHRSVLMRQFEQAATTDSKTGLLNASSWHAIATKEIERARQHGTDLGVLMIDVDHFRDVNNSHGHLVGDKALVLVADAIRSEVRGDDLCARFGGEEFVVLLPGCPSEVILDVADRIRRRVDQTPITSNEAMPAFHVSVSIGAAAYPAAGQTIEDVLVSADNALFAAKDAGRNQIRAIKLNPASEDQLHER